MAKEHRYFVYILASQRNGTLYVGVTDDLTLRAAQHRDEALEGFTRKYGVHMLVWFEEHGDMAMPSRARSGSRNGIATGNWS